MTLDTADIATFSSTSAIDLSDESVNFRFTGTAHEGTVVLASGGGAAVAPDAANVSDDSGDFDTQITASGNDLLLTISSLAPAVSFTPDRTPGETITTTTLTGLTGGGSAVAAVQSALAGATSQGEVNRIADTIDTTDEYKIQIKVTKKVVNRVHGTVIDRSFQRLISAGPFLASGAGGLGGTTDARTAPRVVSSAGAAGGAAAGAETGASAGNNPDRPDMSRLGDNARDVSVLGGGAPGAAAGESGPPPGGESAPAGDAPGGGEAGQTPQKQATPDETVTLTPVVKPIGIDEDSNEQRNIGGARSSDIPSLDEYKSLKRVRMSLGIEGNISKPARGKIAATLMRGNSPTAQETRALVPNFNKMAAQVAKEGDAETKQKLAKYRDDLQEMFQTLTDVSSGGAKQFFQKQLDNISDIELNNNTLDIQKMLDDPWYKPETDGVKKASYPAQTYPHSTPPTQGGQSGIATGDKPPQYSVWGQMLFANGDQGFRKGEAGYDSESVGMIIGVDNNTLIDNAVIGASFSYVISKTDSKSANRTNTDTDNYQLSLYGGYSLDEQTVLSGTVSYGLNDIESVRFNVGNVAGQTAFSEYNAHQFAASVDLARQYQYKGAVITPNVSASWSTYRPDAYRETGSAAGLGQRIDSESSEAFELGVGMTAQWMHQLDNGGIVLPTAGVNYSYDLIGEQTSTLTQFNAGGPTFTTEGAKPAPASYGANLGLTYLYSDQLEFSVGYGYTGRSEFDSHTGTAKIRYRF